MAETLNNRRRAYADKSHHDVKELHTASAREINHEKEHFVAVCFTERSNKERYKKLLDNLKSSCNRGRDEYPQTLIDALDLLVRESEEYDTARRYNPILFCGGREG